VFSEFNKTGKQELATLVQDLNELELSSIKPSNNFENNLNSNNLRPSNNNHLYNYGMLTEEQQMA
jgi:hypothetical protein